MENINIYQLLIDKVFDILVIAIIVPAILLFHDIYKHHHNGRSLWENIVIRFKYIKCRFFYRKDQSAKIISHASELPNDKFINYGKVADNNLYYEDRVKDIKVKMGKEQEKDPEIPYQILIDYTKDDRNQPKRKRIVVENERLEEYRLADDMVDITNDAFEEFKKAGKLNKLRKGSKLAIFFRNLLKKNEEAEYQNDKTLRVKTLQHDEKSDTWKCVLQKSDYFTQVRTNLILDYTLYDQYDRERTIRTEDLLNKDTTHLPDFSDSLMANTIGVSAIWHFRRGDENMFFMKPRKKTTGVFGNMLGTVSGVVKIEGEDIYNYKEFPMLEDYLCKEMRREFYEETGFDKYMADKKISESQVKIIPLAFAREFARGGKPQFFFRILTPEISNEDMLKYYRRSFNGFEEFDDSFINASIDSLSLSPETRTNFILAFKDIQKIQGDCIYL